MVTRLPLFGLLALLCGCQSTMLGARTIDQASTVNDLYYQQVVDNLALHAANQTALPYFSYAASGQNALQRTAAANYQLNWDLITSAGALFNRYLVDKQSSTLTAMQQNNETWATTTASDPDKLLLMLYAYQRAFGAIDEEHNKQLSTVLEAQSGLTKKDHLTDQEKLANARVEAYGITVVKLNYDGAVYPGWFTVGCKWQVPKDACYVGRCGKIYVWVTPDHMADLSNFTLAILHLATFESPKRANPTQIFGTTIQ